jgi:hypothetical protein
LCLRLGEPRDLADDGFADAPEVARFFEDAPKIYLYPRGVSPRLSRTTLAIGSLVTF